MNFVCCSVITCTNSCFRTRAQLNGLAVADGDVPPEADLLAPDWWETLVPVRTPVVAVSGAAGATRAASYGWELAAGCGVQPTEDRFATIASADAPGSSKSLRMLRKAVSTESFCAPVRFLCSLIADRKWRASVVVTLEITLQIR